MGDLFVNFERRPDRCAAVYVSDETLDRIARHYIMSGYETDVHRDRIDSSVTLTKNGVTVKAVPGQAIIFGHPPTVVDYTEFTNEWRPETPYTPDPPF